MNLRLSSWMPCWDRGLTPLKAMEEQAVLKPGQLVKRNIKQASECHCYFCFINLEVKISVKIQGVLFISDMTLSMALVSSF